MFSPDTASHGHSLRPKRTRQAAGPDDSMRPPAKRKRSALRKDTFEPLAEASLNEVAGRQGEANGHAIGSEKTPNISIVSGKELAFRGGRIQEKRQDRRAGAFTLSSNEVYTFAQLPALPDQIRNRPGIPYTCTISPEHGYAIALTHTEALVWAYNSSSTSPSSRDLLSFILPFPPSSASDPLPLAAFTARSAAGEPGLLAVSPRWGKIVYWETLANASSFVPGQISNGVQGSLPSLGTAEFVQEIVNAEPAGFVMCSNLGRAFHVVVRDQMGRPGVAVQTLRRPITGTLGGLFGSIRHALVGDRRSGTPIVRAGKASKGQRDLIVASEDAEMEFWTVNVGIGDSMIKSINAREVFLEALQAAVPKDIHTTSSFKVLDIGMTKASRASQEIVKSGEEYPVQFTVLAQLSNNDRTNYYLIEAQIRSETLTVRVVHPITCYSAPLSGSATWRPRLYISESTNLAFVIFEASIVIFSLAIPEETPSSQLFLEDQPPREPFQDCVKFQDNSSYRVITVTGEETEKGDNHATLVLAISAFGIVRLTASSPIRHSDEEDETSNYQITAKTKIEQAVFFGSIRTNPLDLTSSTPGQSFSSEDVCAAALEISNEILTSTSKYLPKSTPSIETQMKLRAKALEDLATYAIEHHSSSLDRSTRFNLLWNAQKLSAGQAIWQTQQSIEKRYPTLKDREMPYMHFVLRALHESRQVYPDAEKGESDRVRHWLTHSLDKIGYFMCELVSCINALESMDVNDPQVVAEYLREAQDIWIAAYDAAFKFDEENCQNYGLGDEAFKDGVLQGGYPEDTAQLWTAAPKPLEYGERFISRICKVLNDWRENPSTTAKSSKKNIPVNEDGKPYAAPSKQVLSDLVDQLPRQADLVIKVLDESFNDKRVQLKREATDPASQAERLASIDDERIFRRRATISRIAEFNKQGAIALAEKISDTPLLVDANLSYIHELSIKKQEAAANNDSAEVQRLDRQLTTLQDHAETYYSTFGKAWALAHFSRNVQDGDLIEILQEAQHNDGSKQHYLTWFLNESRKISVSIDKISWINDIVGEKQYHRALSTLESMSLNGQDDLWSKKTETCLAKLTSFAASEDAEANGLPSSEQRLKTMEFDEVLDVIETQQALVEHILSLTTHALDTQAALELVMNEVGVRVVKDKPALRTLLSQSLADLIAGKALSVHQIVDALTLMDPFPFQGTDEEEDPAIFGHEFSLALRVVDVSGHLNQVEKQALQRLIWRRAMIRDNWLQLNETSLKDDETVQRDMQMSSVSATLVELFLKHLQHPSNTIRLWSPQEILDSELFPPSLQERFEGQELNDIETDLQAEQDRLSTFVEKGRLELHFGGLVQTAEDAVRSVSRGAEDANVQVLVTSGEERHAEPIELDDMQVSQTNGFH